MTSTIGTRFSDYVSITSLSASYDVTCAQSRSLVGQISVISISLSRTCAESRVDDTFEDKYSLEYLVTWYTVEPSSILSPRPPLPLPLAGHVGQTNRYR